MTDASLLTAGRVRQARALLAWSQRDLASQASLAVSTVADFERGYRVPVPNNLEAMRTALGRAGVSFVAGGAIIGSDREAVIAARSGGLPIRFIEATDLAGEWADRRYGAQEQMPTVISNLIRASVGLAAHLNFPAVDSIQHPGWDGFCEVKEGTEYIPAGQSVWEFGAQAKGITSKANEDYEKRSREIPASDRKNMTFVFVTPRRWREKAKWVMARRAERAWREVIVVDADKLVHWLEIFPAVGHWLATCIGKRPRGVRQLQELWDEWSRSTKPPMTADLMLAGRQDAEVSVWRWLNGPPGVLAIRAESVEEALAFGYAAIEVLPADRKATLLARSLFATEPDQARTLGDSLMPLFLLLNEPEPGLATSLAAHGHHVYAAYGPGVADGEAAVSLARPPRCELQRQLEAMQIDRERAAQLAQDAGQSMIVLRRLMPSAPGLPSPQWAKPEHAPSLIVALLAGVWDEGAEGDRSVIERLGNNTYANIVGHLTQWLGPLDSPLRKAGQTWKIASPRDAWFRLAPKYLTADHLNRFADIAVEVLSAKDPRYDLPGTERWLSSVSGVQPAYTDTLSVGLTETLGLLAIFGKEARGVVGANHIAEDVVRRLLMNADERRWWSLSSRMEALAEACPDAFLDALEDSLDRDRAPVMVLFQEDEGGLAGPGYLTSLLWALEILARSPRFLGRAARLLARLADADPFPKSRHASRPARSLGQIFNLFFPQTNASLADRLRVLNVLRKEEPRPIWQLLLGMLPKGHAIGDFGPLPRWRDFSETKAEEVTWPLIWNGAETIMGWLFEEAGILPHRWEQLIELFSQFSQGRRAEMTDLLKVAASRLTLDEDRARIWKALRHMINHHRKFAKSDWALPEDELAELESAYHLYEPNDPVTRVAWLFSGPEAELLQPSVYERDAGSNCIDADRRMSDALRCSVINDLLGRFGPEALYRIVSIENVASGLIGVALAHSGVDDAIQEDILIRSLRSEDAREAGIAVGLVLTMIEMKGRSWSEALLLRAIAEKWSPEQVARLLIILPGDRRLWERIPDFGAAVETLYWGRVRALLPPNSPGADFEFLAIKLMENGRAHDAVVLLVHGKDIVRSSLLAEALEVAANQSRPQDTAEHQPTMFEYYVEELLQRLDQAGDIPEDRIALIEWRYLPVLIHSRRTTLTLHKAMAQQPELFVMVLRALYKPDPESGFVEEPAGDEGNAKALATRAHDLLRSWHVVPGSSGSNLEAAGLEGWIEETRRRCQEIGRASTGDYWIGQMLAHAPAAEDGVWPAISVREVIKITRSHYLDRGVVQGLCNKRGATWGDPLAGGELERALAAQYRWWAHSMDLEWPRTSAILEQVARFYDGIGKSKDDDTERRNW
jgi:transcriptional regulator with XRE-family HTH domain